MSASNVNSPGADYRAVLEEVAPSVASVATDPLTDLFQHLRMDGMFYCLSELTAPWGLDLPSVRDALWFHIVTKGELRLIDQAGRDHTLRAGDVALLPHGSQHLAVDQPGAPTPVVFDLPHDYISRHYAVLRHGGGGTQTTIVCGVMHLGHPAGRRLLAALPDIIRHQDTAGSQGWDWLPTMLSLIASEARSPGLGTETIITRLCDVLVVQVIRAWLDDQPEVDGWIRAIRDPVVGRAMALVHRELARPWTVVSLAQAVGISRSGLSARFSELTGQSPKQYITSWRMLVADELLADPARSLRQIAAELGYQSEAAFSRAYKRETGLSPSLARRPSPSIDESALGI